jgi:NDP-sugar pyrophosphorylase family protein
MKAFIVAGGLGTRLRPTTLTLPKALCEVAGKPIVQHQIEFLRDNGVKDITLIVHYKASQIEEFFADGTGYNVTISYIKEPELLGTAGWLNLIESKPDEDFLILYGDIFLKFNLQKFIQYHQTLPSDNVVTIMAQPKEYPLECDHLVLDDKKRIMEILFRPHANNQVQHNLANGSIYLARPFIFEYIPKFPRFSFEKDVFGEIIRSSKHNIYAYESSEYFKDIGTRERLKQVEDDIYFSRI